MPQGFFDRVPQIAGDTCRIVHRLVGAGRHERVVGFELWLFDTTFSLPLCLRLTFADGPAAQPFPLDAVPEAGERGTRVVDAVPVEDRLGFIERHP